VTGKATWFEFTASNQMQNPALTGIVINARDISENRAFQERLHHEATHDALTGCRTGAACRTRWAARCATTRWPCSSSTSTGSSRSTTHTDTRPATSCCARWPSGSAAASGRATCCARVGGDEFVVLMPGSHRAGRRDTMSHPGTDRRGAPVPGVRRRDPHRASVGVHLATTSDDPDQALRAADHAMYAVKHLGGAAAPTPAAYRAT
jgi:GGDEF domain-containing protein